MNGEAIFASRPWTKFGEGPSVESAGSINERGRKPLTPKDIRFTVKNGKLYVFTLGWPEGDIEVQSLGSTANLWNSKIQNIRLLGSEEKLKWTIGPHALRITRPAHQPCQYAIVFEVS
jgi:alpha-L-fucosidase